MYLDLLVSRNRSRGWFRFGPRMPPRRKSLASEFEDGPAIFRNYFPPGESAEHGEIDSAEADARDEDVDAIAERLVG